MKTIYIETRRKFNDSEINLKVLDNLPGKTISLAATIQYIGLIPKIKDYLEKKGKKVIVKKGAKYKGHVLGCNSNALDKNADTIILITDGRFHAINNAIQLQREISVFNTKTLEKVTKEEIDLYNNRTKAKKAKFLSSNHIGLLISNKPGQKAKNIGKIKKQIEKLEKKVYIFESNNISMGELENFPNIDIWINTACFGLARDDSRIINLSDIIEFLK